MGSLNIWNTNNTNKASLTFTGSSDKTVDTNTVLQSTDSTASIANGKVVVDSSGNVGIGVVPSSWTLAPALDIKQPGVGIWNSGSNDLYIQNNAYYNNGWKYGTSGVVASQYRQNAGSHTWFTAPSGTAGNAITWTQPMTLNSSGRLLLGTTTDDGVNTLQVNGNVGISTASGTQNAIKWSNGTRNGYAYVDSSGIGIFDVSLAGTNANGMYVGTYNNSVSFQTAGATKATIDSSGNVGIGTSSPSYTLQVKSNTTTTGAVVNHLAAFNRQNSNVASLLLGSDGNTDAVIAANNANLRFGKDYNGSFTEYARIDSSGKLLLGTTTAVSGYTMSIGNGTSYAGIFGTSNGAGVTYAGTDSVNSPNSGFIFGHITSTGKAQVRCGSSGGVELASGGTSWSSMSDERLKDIIEPISDAVNKVSTLRAVIGKYKTDEENVRRSFLIAQDVKGVLPEAVSTTTISKENNVEFLTVAYTDVIPLLVASIKELNAKLEALEAKLGEVNGN